MAVLVLQASPASVVRPAVPPMQKATGALIGRRPDQIADALEAEHRVINEKRDRVDPVVGIGSSRGDERTHGAGFGDAFLQNLPVLRLLVVEQGVHIHRLVELADVGVNADLPEQRLHAEGAGFVGNDGHDQLADFRIAQQLRQQPHENHGRGNFAAVGALAELLKMRFGYRLDGRWPLTLRSGM